LQGEEWTFGRWQQTWCRYLSDFYVLYFHVSCFAPCETFRLSGFMIYWVELYTVLRLDAMCWVKFMEIGPNYLSFCLQHPVSAPA
jgi:hypothetical protein